MNVSNRNRNNSFLNNKSNAVKLVGSAVTFTPLRSKNYNVPITFHDNDPLILNNFPKSRSDPSEIGSKSTQNILRKCYSVNYLPITEKEKVKKHIDDNSEDEISEFKPIGKPSFNSFMTHKLEGSKINLYHPKTENLDKEIVDSLNKGIFAKLEGNQLKSDIQNKFKKIQDTVTKLKTNQNTNSGDIVENEDNTQSRYSSFINYEDIRDNSMDCLSLFIKEKISSFVFKCLECNLDKPDSVAKITELQTSSPKKIDISKNVSHDENTHENVVKKLSKFPFQEYNLLDNFSNENSPIIIITASSLHDINECATSIKRNFSLSNLKPIKSYDSFKGFSINSFCNGPNGLISMNNFGNFQFIDKFHDSNNESDKRICTVKGKCSLESSKSEPDIYTFSKNKLNEIILYNMIPNFHPRTEKLSCLIQNEHQVQSHLHLNDKHTDLDSLSNTEYGSLEQLDNSESERETSHKKEIESKRIVSEMQQLIKNRSVISGVQKSVPRIASNVKLFQVRRETSKSSLSVSDIESLLLQKKFIKKSWDNDENETSKKTSKMHKSNLNSFEQLLVSNMKNKLLGETINLLKSIEFKSDDSDYDDDISLSTYTTQSSLSSDDESFIKKLSEFRQKFSDNCEHPSLKEFQELSNFSSSSISSSSSKYSKCRSHLINSNHTKGKVTSVEGMVYRDKLGISKSISRSDRVRLSTTPAHVSSIAPTKTNFINQ